jgi:AraC family transcriptional regulator
MLASQFNYSVYHFIRIFEKHLGISPYQYIINLRLHKAVGLLLSTNKSITEIARATNFSSIGRLSSCFRRQYGMTPLQYRKSRVSKKP